MQSQVSTDTAVGESAPFNREEDLIGWRDRGLVALLLLALFLLGWSWARLEGYELADAVEYLERADDLLSRGGMRESASIRSFGFSGLLLPIFFVAEGVEAVTGYQNRVLIAHAARVLQIAMTLGLIGVTARIAGALGGRGAGYAGGALLTASPIVLQWGVTPVSGIAAGLLIALSIEHLVVDDGLYEPRRRGWLAGLGLGGAFMMAYQTILVVVPIFALIFLRRRARPVVARSLVVLGVALCVLTQMGLDYLYYGAFGKSVLHYFVLNFGTVVPGEIHRAGELLHLEPLKDLARWLYDNARETLASDEEALLASYAEVRTKLPRNWYLVNLPSALTWPGVLALGTGIGFILYKRARMPLSLLVIATFNIAAMSEKGSKDFRLFLPFLSILAVLGGLGFRAFAGNSRPRLGIGVALLALAVGLGAHQHAQTNRTRHGAFWRAMAHVNREAEIERAASPSPGPAERAACTFHWSVLLRESQDVELDKLPLSIDRWESYTERERAAALAQLARLDWFIAHLPALTEHPEVLAFVAREFAVQAAFYDRRDAGDFGPVLVLERRSGDPDELVLYETREGLDPAAWAAARGLSRPLAFGRAGELLLLGTEFDRLPGDGHGWLTYHWYGVRLERDVTVVDRITSPGSTHSWHNNHRPAYGMLPTSSWPDGVVAPPWRRSGGAAVERPIEGPIENRGGWILSEGYLVVPEADPYIAEGPERFIGGDYMRGDLVPGDLWVDVGTLSPDGEVLERLDAVRPSDGAVVGALAPPMSDPTPDGWSTSHDGMTRVASFLIPITGRQRERARRAGPGGG